MPKCFYYFTVSTWGLRSLHRAKKASAVFLLFATSCNVGAPFWAVYVITTTSWALPSLVLSSNWNCNLRSDGASRAEKPILSGRVLKSLGWNDFETLFHFSSALLGYFPSNLSLDTFFKCKEFVYLWMAENSTILLEFFRKILSKIFYWKGRFVEGWEFPPAGSLCKWVQEPELS